MVQAVGQPPPPDIRVDPCLPCEQDPNTFLGVDSGEPRSLASRRLCSQASLERRLPGERGPSPAEGLQLTWL